MEFSTRIIEFEKCNVKAQLWDTAGQERFESMTKIYYRDAVGAALVYDISNRQSFDDLKQIWLPQLREYGHESMKIVLGKLKFCNPPICSFFNHNLPWFQWATK